MLYLTCAVINTVTKELIVMKTIFLLTSFQLWKRISPKKKQSRDRHIFLGPQNEGLQTLYQVHNNKYNPVSTKIVWKNDKMLYLKH